MSLCTLSFPVLEVVTFVMDTVGFHYKVIAYVLTLCIYDGLLTFQHHCISVL